MQEIERLEKENVRLYEERLSLAKQIKLLNSKLKNSTDNDMLDRAFDKLRQFIKGELR
jgi:cell division protein FtsB